MNDAAPVYLDYAATTPVDPRVAREMQQCLTAEGDFGNASSAHAYGAAAAARIGRARAQVAALVGADAQEITFTSGATESNNLAILGAAHANAHRGRHLLTLRTEHKAVLDPYRHLEKSGFTATYLTPARNGVLEPAVLAAALRPDTVLVSIMYANNETGVLQDIRALGALCRERGIVFHSDCAQAAGKLALDVHALPVDLVSFTAHKLCGPKGVGALYVARSARPRLWPVSFGGGQEQGLRPGTLPTHQIAGFGLACELAHRELSTEPARLEALRVRLWEGLATLPDAHLNGAGAPHAPGILNVSFGGVDGESLISGLEGLAVSAGAACNSETGEPSYVLRALGRDSRLAESSLRFSFGRFTRESDVDFAVRAVRRQVLRLRSMSPAAPIASVPGVVGAAWPPEEEIAGELVAGEAGSPAEGTWVRFQLRVGAGKVKDARFLVLGCPHTMDTVAWLCAQLPGRSREALVPGSPADWAEARAVPVEKLGRLLVVEDALRACRARWA
ncbi:MAG: aminotransferase class V-fold PLP-dependent enzyme [Proteobacteria bacterium]|nr:aminotransferase class V-fold PLP-dependent enzyme [Pseudomonadota bacterium]